MIALGLSFVIAVIPPVVGYLLVPETLGMRQIDFNEEKKEEKLHRAMSGEEQSTIGYIMMSLSGDHPETKTGLIHRSARESKDSPHELV